jgi:hypothetical protein
MTLVVDLATGCVDAAVDTASVGDRQQVELAAGDPAVRPPHRARGPRVRADRARVGTLSRRAVRTLHRGRGLYRYRRTAGFAGYLTTTQATAPAGYGEQLLLGYGIAR